MAATDSIKSTKPSLRLPSPSTTFSSFPSHLTPFFHCPTSPSRANFCVSSVSAVPSVRFTSVNTGAHSGQAVKRQSHRHQKLTCMCSPTKHPGSFRCSLHKNFGSHSATVAQRSAMTNSLVRIRGVEREVVKRALAALIWPSTHHQWRRRDFRPRPSRLCAMSKAEEDS